MSVSKVFLSLIGPTGKTMRFSQSMIRNPVELNQPKRPKYQSSKIRTNYQNNILTRICAQTGVFQLGEVRDVNETNGSRVIQNSVDFFG
ncbi:hypothetical protein YC2023_020525 [Brassica napus]